MKKKCLDSWLEALRSEKYTRCSGGLHRDDGFCALGVLCDISALDTWKKDPYSNKYQYLGQVNYLPKEVLEWAGITSQEYKSLSAFIMVYNDNLKTPLSDMAELLESKYKKKPKKDI